MFRGALSLLRDHCGLTVETSLFAGFCGSSRFVFRSSPFVTSVSRVLITNARMVQISYHYAYARSNLNLVELELLFIAGINR